MNTSHKDQAKTDEQTRDEKEDALGTIQGGLSRRGGLKSYPENSLPLLSSRV